MAPNFDFMGQLLDFEKQLEVQYGHLSDDNGEYILDSSVGSIKKTVSILHLIISNNNLTQIFSKLVLEI